MSGERLHDEWFRQTSETPSPPQWPSTLRPGRPAGDPFWSTLGGAVGGLIGAVAVLALPKTVDLRTQPAIGAATVLVGAALGAAFGRMTRRLLRVVPRIALGAIVASTVWLAVYAFLILRFAPQLTTSLPFASSVLDALIFGACLGVLPPLRVRNERGRRP
jgi:hypothetical protein